MQEELEKILNSNVKPCLTKVLPILKELSKNDPIRLWTYYDDIVYEWSKRQNEKYNRD